MFVVIVHYIQPLSEIDARLEEHVAYLKRQYQAGVFVASGRQVPRSGGVILARAANRQALRAVLEQDPFSQHGLAEYQVIEFTPSLTAPDCASLQEA